MYLFQHEAFGRINEDPAWIKYGILLFMFFMSLWTIFYTLKSIRRSDSLLIKISKSFFILWFIFVDYVILRFIFQ